MRITVRILGGILVLVALGALAWDLMILLETGAFKLTSWGALWYELHPASLNLYQVGVERYISAALWDKILAPLLVFEAVFVFAIPGLFLAALPGLILLFRRVFFRYQGTY